MQTQHANPASDSTRETLSPEAVVRRLIDVGFSLGRLEVAEELIAEDCLEHQDYGPNQPPPPPTPPPPRPERTTAPSSETRRRAARCRSPYSTSCAWSEARSSNTGAFQTGSVRSFSSAS